MKILVVGQGYAGSLLSFLLLKNGVDVSVVDNNPAFSSSKVAAGIMIPVTGRRLAKTHLADQLIPFARKIYKEIEQVTESSFYFEKQVLQIFSSVSNLNEWYARSSEPGMINYCGEILNTQQVHASITNEFGGILLNESGYVDSMEFLQQVKNYLKEKSQYWETRFFHHDLKIKENQLFWKDTEWSHIIFCEGYHNKDNPYFDYLPFKPAKGEIIDFTSSQLADDYIISNSIYILPLGHGRFRAGATYVWDDLAENTTEAGRSYLTEHLARTISCDFEVSDHKAGIRPAIRDRRPLAGFHPLYNNMGILNGFGTKGAMLGPWYANQMAELILNQKPVDADVSVRRFDSIWKAI